MAGSAEVCLVGVHSGIGSSVGTIDGPKALLNNAGPYEMSTQYADKLSHSGVDKVATLPAPDGFWSSSRYPGSRKEPRGG